jgi:DNA-binding IscR family transcriptional regulator
MVTKSQTDTFSHAVDALRIIAVTPDGIISSDRIGQQLGLNPVVVRRLLAPLRSAGLLQTRRGAGGGWALARDPAALHLGDVYRALRVPHADRSGVFAHLMARAEAAFVAELDGSTLADIIP